MKKRKVISLTNLDINQSELIELITLIGKQNSNPTNEENQRLIELLTTAENIQKITTISKN
jgi:hypothetical protein